MRKSLVLLCLVGVFGTAAFTATSSQAASLTGLVLFSTDSTGSLNNGYVADTFPAGWWNMYVDPDPEGGAFLNSGNGPSTLIDITLNEGTHSFTLWSDNSAGGPEFALNLFFNGGVSNPGISVFAPLNGTSYSVNSSSSTYAPDAVIVPGAGSLSFVDGLTTVTLTNYSWGCCGGDRVQPLDNTPGRFTDMVGHLTLEVSTVPEPNTALLLGFGLVGLGVKRRSRTSHSVDGRVSS